MALSLTAEQKNISSLFYNEDQYIIPEFQRPYCWTYETSYQLYTDIMTYYYAQEDFFVGNIVMARSDEYQNKPQVVDGQQRMITLWLWMKSLTLLVPAMGKLKEGVSLLTWEDDAREVPKLRSNVIDSSDPKQLNDIWSMDAVQVEKLLSQNRMRIESQVLLNFLNIYSWLKKTLTDVSEEEKRKFVKFFIYKIYLLPIELKGKTEEEANERALMIFETINNRGQNLEDADIFKAKLYNKAVSVGRKTDFLNRWIRIKDECESLDISIEDLFKYYSHILRGKKGITSFETSLRDFFTKGPNAPIIVSDYEQVTDELSHVLDVLQIIYRGVEEISDLGMWLKILKMYSNKFPMFAIVSYLYKYGKDEGYVDFLKLLTRVCYSYGPSATVKFTIYNIIADIFSDVVKKKKSVDYCMPNLESLNTRFHLKKGLFLLTYYIVVKQPLIGTPSVETIIRPSKTTTVDEIIRNMVFQLGNFFIIDKIGDTIENDYNSLFFDFKYKKIKSGRELLSMVNERTQKLLTVLYDFLADKQ